MTDTLPTVWPAEPHTLVKHAILRRYLEAWFPILTQQAQLMRQQFNIAASKEILFIDGFAGPGTYSGGEDGSPVIAIKAALNHSLSFPIPVRMLFIEQREDRFNHLKQVLAPYLKQSEKSRNVHAAVPQLGDCDTVLNSMLDQCEQSNITFGPALAFLDQFGYGAVSMQLIERILKYGQCEVFTYLSYKEMNRWISDPHKRDAFTRAFGGDEWKQCVGLPEQQRRERLLAMYKSALKARAGATYVVSFLMFDRNNAPLYWLLFCTNSLRGLEEMKKAMWFVDKHGEFRFSDRENVGQLDLLEMQFGQEWLADELVRSLQGQTLSAPKLKEHVLVESPCYLFKGALKKLEKDRSITVRGPVCRKPGTYPDEMLQEISIAFARSMF